MILVTGGCGYIGSHVVKALSERGEQVIVYDNLTAGRREALLHGEILEFGDITDQKQLKAIFQKYPIEEVIHLAALVNAAESIEKQHEYQHVNYEGSRLVWQRAQEAGVKRILFASSAAVYGLPQNENALREDAPLLPTNPYGESKLEAEIALKDLAAKTQIKYGIFRFFNVAGAESGARLYQNPNNRAILTRLFAAAAGLIPQIEISGHDYPTVDGTVVRDFVHVEDISRAHLLALDYLRSGGDSFTLNLGSGEGISMTQLAKIVEQVTGTPITITYGPRKSGDISYSLADITQAKMILSWQPQKSRNDTIVDGWRAYRAHTT